MGKMLLGGGELCFDGSKRAKVSPVPRAALAISFGSRLSRDFYSKSLRFLNIPGRTRPPSLS